MKRIPRPEELHAPLREALKKDMELSLSMAPLTARASVLRAEEREQRIDDNNPTDNNRVRALTGEPLIVEASGKSELDAVLLSLQDRNAARNRLGTIIRNQKAIASRLVCDEVRPEVTRLGKLFANAFVALHAAQHEYHSYLDQVENTGASIGSLPNVFISGLGSARDLSGTFMYAMKDFVEVGFLQKSDIPKVLQQ